MFFVFFREKEALYLFTPKSHILILKETKVYVNFLLKKASLLYVIAA